MYIITRKTVCLLSSSDFCKHLRNLLGIIRVFVFSRMENAY